MRGGVPAALIGASIAAVALCIGGCSNSRERSEQAAPTPPSVSGAVARLPTTTVPRPKAYSFDRAPAPPSVENRGTDYTAIAESLLRFDSWVYSQDPDPALIPRVAAPGSTFDGAIRHDTAILRRLDRRCYEVQTGPNRVAVIDATPNAVTLRVVQPLVAQRVVDPAGRITSERKLPHIGTAYLVLITRMSDGRWLLADIEERGRS